MALKRFLGSILSATPPTVGTSGFEDSSASGRWSPSQILSYIADAVWPTQGNTPVYVDDVFSTYLYVGRSGASGLRTIDNGINLQDEGGLIWTRERDNAAEHLLIDTERGLSGGYLATDASSAANTSRINASIDSFTTSGYKLDGGGTLWDRGTYKYFSWTFRKQAGFFDVVTWTGDNSSNRQISHNLGCVPAMILIKRTDFGDDWIVYHVGMDSTAPEDYYMVLNDTAARTNSATHFNDTAPTATNFTIGGAGAVNQGSASFVAYLFAGTGDAASKVFGENQDQSIIKCGTYTGTGSAGNAQDIGFEPQWLLIRSTSGGVAFGEWGILDVMRGFTVYDDQRLLANTTASETTSDEVTPTATGFEFTSGSGGRTNGSGTDYIYVAIRRSMKPPTAGTQVFSASYQQEYPSATSGFYSGFVTDLAIKRIMSASQQNYLFDRLRGEISLITNSTAADSGFGAADFDHSEGYYVDTESANTSDISWMFKRAVTFMDTVNYTGTGSNTTFPHNLGVAPELLIIKKTNASGESWTVWNKTIAAANAAATLWLNSTSSVNNYANRFNSTAPTASVFSVGNDGATNGSGSTYTAYMFATVAGVSKVGSYTGNGSSQNIDCGFTSSARFILIRRTDSSGNWNVFDSIQQGIGAGNDTHFALNNTDAPVTSDDMVGTYSSGFAVTSSHGHVNASGGSYIFLAVA